MPDRPKFILPAADTASPLRALHSLRESHVAELSRRIAGLPGTWSLERHESYDGDLTAVLIPHDESAGTFVVSHAADGFHLAANCGDNYRTLGCFASIDRLAARIIAVVAGPPQGAANPPAAVGA